MEFEQGSDRRDARHGRAQVPVENVEIVAALGHDHGGGDLSPPPVPSYVRVGHMPRAHVLAVLDRHDVAQTSALNHLPECLEEGGETKNVADVEAGRGAGRSIDEFDTLSQSCCHRLFGEDVISRLQGSEDVAMMGAIGRGNYRRRGYARYCQQGVGIAKAMAGRNAVGITESLDPIRTGVGDGHDPESLGMIERPSSVDEVPALARPDQDRVRHQASTRAMAPAYGTTLTKETPDARRQMVERRAPRTRQVVGSDLFFRLASGVWRLASRRLSRGEAVKGPQLWLSGSESLLVLSVN